MKEKNEKWLGRTAYQLMPDRFKRKGDMPAEMPGRILKDWNDRMPNWQPNSEGVYKNDYFYGGNLKGIIEKIPYFKELGINMIYLTPINESESYHHYDVGNHMKIDPWLGDWKDFKKLCEIAHKNDILIMPDLVFNHTGIHSIYFNDPKCVDWYKKDENGKHKFWWDFEDMPMCETTNPDYQKAMKKVVEKYLENGADGFRLDLGEELSSEFLEAIQEVKKKYPETIFIGEMWGIATNHGNGAKIYNGQLDSVMNYPMTDAIMRWIRFGYFEHFTYNFNQVYLQYPKDVQNILLNNIGTHDIPLAMTMAVGEKMNSNVFDGQIWDIEKPWRHGKFFDTYGFRKYEAEHDDLNSDDYDRAKKLTKLAIAIMYTMPGIPCLYFGTEIGEMGYKDPFCRKPYDWKRMENDIKWFVSSMGNYRKYNKDILKTGNVKLVRVDNKLLILERSVGNKHIILVANRTTNTEYIKYVNDMYENLEVIYSENASNETLVNPLGLVILRTKK